MCSRRAIHFKLISALATTPVHATNSPPEFEALLASDEIVKAFEKRYGLVE